MANELSPMAAETFAYNFFNEDLAEKAELKQMPEQAIWLKSRFDDLKARLRENPSQYPAFTSEGFSEFPNDINNINGKLIVGNIIELNKIIDASPQLQQALQSAFSRKGGLDLVSGGPPCQSFSMAGKREKNSDKNQLPWEFAKFVEFTQPKIALLENVTGILRAFKDDNGNSFHAWYEVAKVFASINYIPLCLHVNARNVGVAQNRPRFIMIGIRQDHFELIQANFNETEQALFEQSLTFFQRVNEQGEQLRFGHLNYFDSTKEVDRQFFLNSFLAPLVSDNEVSVRQAIDDLKIHQPAQPSEFITALNLQFNLLQPRNEIHNHEFRNNNPLVKRRFRLYQILQTIGDRTITQSVFKVLKGQEPEITPEAWNAISTHNLLHQDGKLHPIATKLELEQYLHAHPTKKQTQKALIADAPAPAALSIPDDACHYDENELRVLTVREMARIQSFPDNFVFRSKVTTGGQMRKFEVPQYTQVGNAVPPVLGVKLGEVIGSLL